MIKIQITSPFRYQFRTSDHDPKVPKDKVEKDLYLTAGEYYHLDPKKDKDEIKFVLSPNFTFKDYIYVNAETVPKDLKSELNFESGFYKDSSVPEDEYIPTLLEHNKLINPSDYVYNELDLNPSETKDASENIFDLTTKVSISESEIKDDVILGALNTPTITPLEKPSEEIIDVSVKNEERESRKQELEELHYSKVKEVAELYNLEYKTKKETIKDILELEFGNPESEFSRNIEL